MDRERGAISLKFMLNEHGFQTNVEFGELKISGQAEYGYRPFQLMISSIAGCSGGVLRNILQKMRLSFEDIIIEAKVTSNKDETNRIEHIHFTYIIEGKNISSEKIEKALKLARKNCSMIQSVQDSIQITEDFQLKP